MGECKMADNVQWIKLKVGMFDGNSFKKIKRAKIGGVSYRDKLTAIWFELLDLAGKSNANGYLVDSNEIPYHSFEDIAVMLDREEKEIELCMQFFINERMVEIIDDIYCLTNFMQYQNQDGLAKIREQNRERQARFREKKKLALLPLNDSNVTDNVTSRFSSLSISISSEEIKNYFEKTYKIYPKSTSKVKAREVFERKLIGLDKKEAESKAIKIYHFLEQEIKTWEQENNGQGRKLEFIPSFFNWLDDNIDNSPNFIGKKK